MTAGVLAVPVWDAATAPAVEPDDAAGLDADTVADVVVVGAGAAGLWTAYYLLEADPGLDVVVVEQARVGAGGSGRGPGWCSARTLVAEHVARAHGVEAARSVRAAMRDAVVEVGGVAAAEEIDCGFVYGGAVTVARTLPQLARLRARAAGAAQWGDEEHLLAPDALAEHVVSPGALGGTWTPDCAQLDPARLLRGLAEVVVARGVRLVERTRVVRVSPGAVVTQHGTVRARIAVRATGASALAGSSVGRATQDLLATAPLAPESRHSVGLVRGQSLGDAAHEAVRVRRTSDDRLVVALPATAPGARLSAPDVDRLRRRLAQLLPGAADAAVTHAWRASHTATRDGTPRVGLDRDTGLGWAVGFGDDGLAAANVAGRTVADLVAGTATALTRLPWVDGPGATWASAPVRDVMLLARSRRARLADAVERRTGRAVTDVARHLP